ncbi:MAG: hypothetical protein ACNA76_01445 [Anaerosomatales bacterium]
MAAKASCTEAVREHGSRRGSATARWTRAFAGIAWGHACLIAASTLVPAEGIRAGAELGSPALRVLEWTLLLPLSLSVAVVHGSASPLDAMASEGLPLAALPLPALAGWAIVALVTALLATRRRAAARAVLALVLLAGCVSGVASARIAASERAAEQLFLRMVATDSRPWEDPGSRSAARTLVARHPDSRWASEAWRVIAIDAEQRGDVSGALAGWRAFAECFGDTAAPGPAFAALSVARLLEQSAPADISATHYLRAHRSIGAGEESVQAWIAPESARGLVRVSRREGLYATAWYWERRSYPDTEE